MLLVTSTNKSIGTSKVYKGYQVTKLGAQQVYNSGSFYRERYIESGASHKIINISGDVYKPSQIWASGPDQSVRKNIRLRSAGVTSLTPSGPASNSHQLPSGTLSSID